MAENLAEEFACILGLSKGIDAGPAQILPLKDLKKALLLVSSSSVLLLFLFTPHLIFLLFSQSRSADKLIPISNVVSMPIMYT